MHVQVDIVGDADLWTVTVDDVLLYAGPLQWPYEQMQAIRLSLNDYGELDSIVYVDNVVIRGIPSPATLALLAVGALISRRRRRGAGPGIDLPDALDQGGPAETTTIRLA
jgi:hypothetical protein